MNDPVGPREQYTIVLEVPPGYNSRERLDIYITAFVENATRSRVAEAIREGRVLVNGKASKPSYPVQARDRIECHLQRMRPVELVAQDIPIDILYEDEAVIVVDKPAGMVVHPAYGHRDGTLVNALLHHVGFEGDPGNTGLSSMNAGARFQGDPTVRPGLVHRLDKDTSGVLVIAKSDTAHHRLAKQLSARTMVRRYKAILLGAPSEANGRIETRLGRDPKDRRRVAVVEEPAGKAAVTHIRVDEAFHCAAGVTFRLETGRTHQIRVHAAHIGHPVLGDPTYGGRKLDRWQKGAEAWRVLKGCLELIDRQALHARSLGFVHPLTGQYVHFESALPAEMVAVLDRLRSRSV